MDLATRLGLVLRDFRRLEKKQQGELAHSAGYRNQSPLSKIERAKKQADFAEVWRLVELLRFRLADLEEGIHAYEEGRHEAWYEELAARRHGFALGEGDEGFPARYPDRRLESLLADSAARDLDSEDRRLLGEMVRGLAAFLRFLVRFRPR